MKIYLIIGYALLCISCGADNAPEGGSLAALPSRDSFDCRDGKCVYIHVDGIRPLKQPSSFSCWAAVLTMIENWSSAKKSSISEVLSAYGEKYVELFNHSDRKGISLEEELTLYRLANMGLLQQLNPTVEGWEYFLAKFGPLSVTVDANPPFGGTIHALLVTGIFGRKDASHTKISFIDPLDGNEHLWDFTAFIKMYEAKYSVDWKIQIVHKKE